MEIVTFLISKLSHGNHDIYNDDILHRHHHKSILMYTLAFWQFSHF